MLIECNVTWTAIVSHSRIGYWVQMSVSLHLPCCMKTPKTSKMTKRKPPHLFALSHPLLNNVPFSRLAACLVNWWVGADEHTPPGIQIIPDKAEMWLWHRISSNSHSDTGSNSILFGFVIDAGAEGNDQRLTEGLLGSCGQGCWS